MDLESIRLLRKKKAEKKLKELQDCQKELKGKEVLTLESPQLQPMIKKINENNPIDEAKDAYEIAVG